jgi:hypothetical protein
LVTIDFGTVLRSWEKLYKADVPFILLASILTMMRVPWTDEETAVLIIFDMWGFKTEAIAEILTNRRAEIRAIVGSIPQYKRTSSAVSNKLTQVRNQNHNLWLKDRRWDRDAVTEFLYRSTLDHDLVARLLDLETDIKIVIRVCVLIMANRVKVLIIHTGRVS